MAATNTASTTATLVRGMGLGAVDPRMTSPPPRTAIFYDVCSKVSRKELLPQVAHAPSQRPRANVDARLEASRIYWFQAGPRSSGPFHCEFAQDASHRSPVVPIQKKSTSPSAWTPAAGAEPKGPMPIEIGPTQAEPFQ
jgi:hypothetical protein